MTTRLSGHFPIFGLVFFALKSLLGMQNNGAVKNLQFRPQSLGSNVRILLYQTWAIVKSLACVQTSPPPSEETSVHRLQRPGCDSFSEIRARAVGHSFFLLSDRLLCSFLFLPAYLDVDKCSNGSHDCHPNATCWADTAGNFTCTCQPGFTGNGRQCYGMIYLFVN